LSMSLLRWLAPLAFKYSFKIFSYATNLRS